MQSRVCSGLEEVPHLLGSLPCLEACLRLGTDSSLPHSLALSCNVQPPLRHLESRLCLSHNGTP